MRTKIKGPRPISLHFSNSQAIWDQAAAVGAQSLGMDIWNDGIKDRVHDFKARLAASGNAGDFDAAVRRMAAERKESFVAGINTYISRPYERPESSSTISHQIGCVTLYDFGGEGKPVLMVPSLVNPYYVLDLMPGRSFAAFLRENGYRPFLLDWGSPGAAENGYGLDAYILERLEPVLQHVTGLAGSAMPVIGYCMGGTLTTALATRNPELVSKLVLMAAPWNFDTEKPLAGRQNAVEMLDLVENLPFGADVGVDMLQTFFTNVDPTLSDRKFRAYQAGKYQGEEADFFSAMEMWANNGPNLARRAAIDCLRDWYRDNLTHKEEWTIGGDIIRPQNIKCPVLVAAPKGDRLVPQESAFAIMPRVRDVTYHEPPSGHIGMVVGNRAKAGLWQPVLNWLGE